MNNPFASICDYMYNNIIYICLYIYRYIYIDIYRIADCRISVVKFGLWLIWGLSGFRSVVVVVGGGGGSLITFEGSWKTQWSDFFHAASQQIQAVCCWASLSILKTLFPAPTVFFSTNQSGLKAPLPFPLVLSLWISFLGDEFIQIGALSKRALSQITCLLGGSVK